MLGSEALPRTFCDKGLQQAQGSLLRAVPGLQNGGGPVHNRAIPPSGQAKDPQVLQGPATTCPDVLI